MHLVRLATLTFIIVGVTAAAPAAPRTFVVLPIQGPVLPSMRSAVDEALREALLPYGDVQTRTDTALILDDASSAGLDCALDAVECIVRIGAIAGATHVMQVQLLSSSSGNGLRAEVSLVEVDVGKVTTVRGPYIVGDGGRGARALVMRALSGKSDPSEAAPAPRSDRVELPEDQPEAPSSTLIASTATTIGGSALALSAGIGAMLIELDLGSPKLGADDPNDIAGQRTFGAILLATMGVGAVTAAVGGVFVAQELAQ